MAQMNCFVWFCLVVDAWGKFPSGIMNGNFFDLGSFPQCFHIKQNEMLYKTQYCIGQIIFKPKELIQRSFTMPRLVDMIFSCILTQTN